MISSKRILCEVPSFCKTWTGEILTDRRLRSLQRCYRSLVKQQTLAERRFTRFMSGFTLYGRRGRHPFWFTPQKQFNIADTISYFVDFYFREAHLAIELDGNQHHYGIVREQDEWRKRILEEHGVALLRFDNADVLSDIARVARIIVSWIVEHSRGLSHRRRILDHLACLRCQRPAFFAMLYPEGIVVPTLQTRLGE